MNNTGGVSIIGLLGLLFIGLKLTNMIDWSWWWVLAPFWGCIALVAALVALFFGGLFAIAALKDLWQWWKRRCAARTAASKLGW